MMQKQQVA